LCGAQGGQVGSEHGLLGHEPLPILIEHFVSVSDEAEAAKGAELWRFLPQGWKPGYFNETSPHVIQRHAEQNIPLEEVVGSWAVSTDPEAHITALQEVVDKGATHIFVHSAQPDQIGVIDFFGQNVLPRVREGAVTGVRPHRLP